jgi:D-glycero-alpha-D-manno-heptose 1-phosphate guanylyltransferase
MNPSPISHDHIPPAIVLVGGLGTRLRALHPECPKPMIPVAGRPFLEWVVEYLNAQGVEQIILSTGYKGDLIEAHFSGVPWGDLVRPVREADSLGTGGAVAHALDVCDLTGWVLVANGDSITQFDIVEMISRSKQGADAVLLGVRVEDAGRFGTLAIGADGYLEGYEEKRSNGGRATINAGIYLLQPALFPQGSQDQPASMELDYLPHWLEEGRRIAVVESLGPFIDMGTPESLDEAAGFIATCGLFETTG